MELNQLCPQENDELKKIQLILQGILVAFQTFCAERSLRYYALGGTVLGAVRHQGFIPWDDDIDVGMPRSDYELLVSSFNTYNNNRRYILESPYTKDSNYSYPYSKIYDTQTTLIENTTPPFKRGVFIDIFPLDGVEKATAINVKTIYFLKKILELKKLKRSRRQRSILRNLVSVTIDYSLKHFVSYKFLLNMINWLCVRQQYNQSDYIANLVGAYNEKEIVPKSCFGNPAIVSFEGLEIPCPKDTDYYLEHIYGEWKSLPPEEKRVTHHSYYLDLNKPYRSFCE